MCMCCMYNVQVLMRYVHVVCSLVPRLSPLAIILTFELARNKITGCKVKGQIIKHTMRVYARGESLGTSGLVVQHVYTCTCTCI